MDGVAVDGRSNPDGEVWSSGHGAGWTIGVSVPDLSPQATVTGSQSSSPPTQKSVFKTVSIDFYVFIGVLTFHCDCY